MVYRLRTQILKPEDMLRITSYVDWAVLNLFVLNLFIWKMEIMRLPAYRGCCED